MYNTTGKRGGAEIIQGAKDLFIVQEPKYIQTFCPWRSQQTYNIFNFNAQVGGQLEQLMTVQEETGCCTRWCCTPMCQPFQMNVNLQEGGGAFLRFVRECTCTCLCLARPVLRVFYVEHNNEQEIGYVVDTWDCCDMTFEIYDTSGAVAYKIKGACCQANFCCGYLCCGPCVQMEFKVTNPGGGAVSNILRHYPGFCECCCSTADNYKIFFNEASIDWKHKALHIALCVLIDMRWFDSNMPDPRVRVCSSKFCH